jgi:hypothetical protein
MEGRLWEEYFICVYENRIMKLIKIWLKKGGGGQESNRGGEYDQSTLYACLEMSQWNSPLYN